MSKISFISLVIVFVLLILGAAHALGEEKKGQNLNQKIENSVYENALHEEKVHVFIRLNTTGDSRKNFNSRVLQEGITKGLNVEQLEYTFDGYVSAFVTSEELDALQDNAEVTRVEKVRTRYISLQDSVPLINGTQTYHLQANGLNLTGSGRAICIIDTGINYTHPDLGGCYGNNNASSTCKVLGGYDFVNSDSNPYDDNGHGTHVSGIAAANGTINGVASGAKIISIKACGASGSCSDADIISGINWCVGNASLYNISVITMSLGDPTNNTVYCNNDPIAASINTAVGNNIPVVIAAGNNANITGISAPSCVQNATAVVATTKSDGVASYSSRGLLAPLTAPGSSINSTYIGTNPYALSSGTSMAAPHVAGIIAVLAEYLNLTNQIRTPAQLVVTLNITGKQINDSATNFSYSRIRLYDAIISLDATAPNITLASPANGTSSLNVNQTFRCNATDLSLRNVTLFVWNSSSSIINQSVRTISGNNNAAEFNATNLTRGTHQWNCLFTDENNNIAFAAPNRTITVADLTTMLAAPSNEVIVSSNQTLSCNATTTATLSNSTLYVWNSTGALINMTIQNISGTLNTTNFSYNFLNEGVHSWNCLFVTSTNLEQFAETNFSVTYDVTRPRVNITTPANNSWQNRGNLNVTLNENGSCIASFTGGVTNITLSSTDNRIFNATNSTLTHGTNYDASYYCNDSAGNFNRSTVQSFTVDLTGPNVTLIAPNNSYNLTTSSTTIVFNYSVVDEINISSCSLILNGVVNLTNSSIANTTANHSFTQTLSPASYTWIVNCTDEAGNIGNSSARTFTLSAPTSDSGSSSSSSGGGGGGGGAATITGTTYLPTLSDAQQGYTRSLKPSDSIKVAIPSVPSTVAGGGGGTLNTTEHTVTVDNVTATSAYITVRSNPIKIVLDVGQSTKLNFTSATHYDLFVKLENIVNTNANITVKVISEPIPASTITSSQSGAVNNTGNTTAQNNQNATSFGQGDNSKTRPRVWIISLIVLFIGGIIVAISIYLFKYWRGFKEKTDTSDNVESH